jgi:hypothetical protein
MGNSLIAQVSNPYRIQELRDTPPAKSAPLIDPPLEEGEYIPPELVDSQQPRTLDILNRLFNEIDARQSPQLEHKENGAQNAYGFSAYQESQKLIGQGQKRTGNYIDIFI